jgi:hypothetical protein
MHSQENSRYNQKAFVWPWTTRLSSMTEQSDPTTVGEDSQQQQSTMKETIASTSIDMVLLEQPHRVEKVPDDFHSGFQDCKDISEESFLSAAQYDEFDDEVSTCLSIDCSYRVTNFLMNQLL